MALSLEQQGRLAEAIAQLESAVALAPAPYIRALLGRAYALAGDANRARDILADLRPLAQGQYVSPFDVAVVRCGLGDLDAAFEQLEEAYRQRVFRLVELTLPLFDGLRADARWQDLVRRIGLPPS
jgi:tetratricopeptide (TPR) repeat protein